MSPRRLARTTVPNQRRGVVLLIVAICLLVIGGMLALVIDGARASNAYRELQASSDAAATAGAEDLPDVALAKAVALSFSSVAGTKNARSDLTGVSMSPGYPQTKCLSSVGLPCSPANAIVVKQQVDVPSFFAWILGRGSIPVSATATAIMRGGIPSPLDVIVVIDASASMASACTASGTGVSSPKRVDCAKAGLRDFLAELWPCTPDRANCGAVSGGNVVNPLDRVGLMIFPGLKRASAITREFDCNGTNISSNDVSPYTASAIYTLIGLSSDYKTSSKSTLNGSVSNLVKSSDWSSGNLCSNNGYGSSAGYGIEARGGVGTQFAAALAQAQTELVNNGRSGVQRVIILLSDGDANGASDACGLAVNAAAAATAAGTWVYAIAYGASTSSSTCPDDSPWISGMATMQRIASDSDKFFNQPSADDLSVIFHQIALQLTTARLVDDNTQ